MRLTFLSHPLDLNPHGADECSITLWTDGRWHDLMATDDTEPVWTTSCGLVAFLPRGALLPRALGLEVLRTTDPATLRTAHAWRPVPAWAYDRGQYLVRDIAEALLDAAGDVLMQRVRAEPAPPDTAPGVRRLACLLGVHNRTMGSGPRRRPERLPRRLVDRGDRRLRRPRADRPGRAARRMMEPRPDRDDLAALFGAASSTVDDQFRPYATADHVQDGQALLDEARAGLDPQAPAVFDASAQA